MTVKTKRLVDVTTPRAGQKLQFGAIAAELNYSFTAIATEAGLSRRSLYRIADENIWPESRDVMELRHVLRGLFDEKGASDEQLASMFHAHVTRRSLAQRAGMAPPPAPTPADYAPPIAGATDQPQPIEEVTDMLPTKQTLSLPARKAFSLFVNPFDGDVIDDAQMFTSGEVAFAREACLQAAVGGRFVALVGESGAGKTTVMADLEMRIDAEKRQVILIRPSVLGMESTDGAGKAVKASEILMSLITTLNPLATVRQTLQGRTTQLGKLLSDSCELGNKHLLVIEEAHCLPAATLKHLKRLNEMKLGRTPMLGILLVAQPELKDILRHQATYLREVIQRLEVVDLLPLDNDLQAYLARRASAHGKALEELIDAGGIEAIRTRLTATRRDPSGKSRTVSLCYPLAVNNLLTAALNTAAELGAPIVTRDVVRAV